MHTLQATQREGRPAVANARDLVQLLAQKPLVSFCAGDGHFDQVIVFACEQISLYHFSLTMGKRRCLAPLKPI